MLLTKVKCLHASLPGFTQNNIYTVLGWAGGTGVNGVPYAVLINDSGEAKIAVVDHESYFELSTVGVLELSQIYP